MKQLQLIQSIFRIKKLLEWGILLYLSRLITKE
jgi:hypothetical protein